MLRPSHLPDAVPLSSESAAMQGPLRKCNRGPPPGTAFAHRGRSLCARAQENVQSSDALASGAQEMVLRSVGALGGRHHAMITVNHARTLQAWRTEGVL